MTRSNIDRLIQRFLEHSRSVKALTVCLGAGVSRAAGMPNWDTLIRRIMQDNGFLFTYPDFDEGDVSHVVEYVQHLVGARQFVAGVKAAVENLEPKDLHYAIATLPARAFITTNYDSALEQAVAQSGKIARVISRDADLSTLDYGSVPIIKLNGSLDESEPMIISPLRYSAILGRGKDSDTLRSYLRANFATGLVLFVGFAVGEADFVSLYELYGGSHNSAVDWVLIVPAGAFGGEDPVKKLWSNRGVRIIEVKDADVPAFLRGLTTHLVERRPVASRSKRAKQVFLSGGRNLRTTFQVRQDLLAAGFEVVTLEERSSMGLSTLEKLDEIVSESAAAVVILEGRSEEVGGGYRRAQPNTLMELGYLLGKLGREKVFVLLDDFVEVPSGLAGIQFEVVDLGSVNMISSVVRKWLDSMLRN